VDAVRLVEGFPLGAMNSNTVGRSKQSLEVPEFDFQLLRSVGDQYGAKRRLYLQNGVRLVVVNIQPFIIDSRYDWSTGQKPNVLGVAIIVQRFEFQWFRVAFLLHFGVHHRRVDFLPLVVGEADVLFSEGVGEISRLEVWYVAGGHQVKDDAIRPPASGQLDSITTAKLMEHIRIFIIAAHYPILDRQQLLEIPRYNELGGRQRSLKD